LFASKIKEPFRIAYRSTKIRWRRARGGNVRHKRVSIYHQDQHNDISIDAVMNICQRPDSRSKGWECNGHEAPESELQ
jgi:hypothetical protein